MDRIILVSCGLGAVVVVIAGALLPETRVHSFRQPLGKAFAVHRRMAIDRVYLPTALSMACLISVMYGFESLAPFYIQTDLKHSPVFYSHLQRLLGCLWLGGNFSIESSALKSKLTGASPLLWEYLYSSA